MKRILWFFLAAALCGLLAPEASAAVVQDSAPAVELPDTQTPGIPFSIEALSGVAEDAASEAGGRMSSAIEIALLLTVLSLLPAVLITVTSFTRIVIVLSFVRRALSVNELPPNPVLIGLALFLTLFVMGPVGTDIYEDAYKPYEAQELTASEASNVAWSRMATFLVSNTRQNELALFAELAEEEIILAADTEADLPEPGELPLRVVVPAFVLSELKTAFQMGFLLFLPFLVIDLVVSSVLLSMGMFMLPPVMISTPVKVLVFVLVDGWHLVCQSVVTSFAGV
ncbi:MAG: flagellar type III secretion system pore protein FliP [Planctomycetota bacterium]|nr:flagellar type III secretion system pore protein FliP [Planctomycetota bacterium]